MSNTIHYLVGDATSPTHEGNKIICHICNDVGGWGKGFVVALSRKCPDPEQAFREWHRHREANEFTLGKVQLVQVQPDLWVANMIGQHGLKKQHGKPPIRYEAVQSCLETLGDMAVEKTAGVHMPRIGCGLAGGSWERIEPLIQEALCEKGIEVFVYDFGKSQ